MVVCRCSVDETPGDVRGLPLPGGIHPSVRSPVQQQWATGGGHAGCSYSALTRHSHCALSQSQEQQPARRCLLRYTAAEPPLRLLAVQHRVREMCTMHRCTRTQRPTPRAALRSIWWRRRHALHGVTGHPCVPVSTGCGVYDHVARVVQPACGSHGQPGIPSRRDRGGRLEGGGGYLGQTRHRLLQQREPP